MILLTSSSGNTEHLCSLLLLLKSVPVISAVSSSVVRRLDCGLGVVYSDSPGQNWPRNNAGPKIDLLVSSAAGKPLGVDEGLTEKKRKVR